LRRTAIDSPIIFEDTLKIAPAFPMKKKDELESDHSNLQRLPANEPSASLAQVRAQATRPLK
jgi:hypothetical protein